MDIHDGVLEKMISRFDNKMYHKFFFSMNKEAVDSGMEEKELNNNESDEATDKSQKPNSSRYRKEFNSQWLNDYSWLKHNSEKGMLCELCIHFEKQSSFTTGCMNFRT